jgi:hypothetical protein
VPEVERLHAVIEHLAHQGHASLAPSLLELQQFDQLEVGDGE